MMRLKKMIGVTCGNVMLQTAASVRASISAAS